MPRRRPSRYAVSDIENPSVPVDIDTGPQRTSANTITSQTADGNKRTVRVVGPQFYYNR